MICMSNSCMTFVFILQLRFHLLNAGSDDAISMCIFFKDTRRKDVYKVNSSSFYSIHFCLWIFLLF